MKLHRAVLIGQVYERKKAEQSNMFQETRWMVEQSQQTELSINLR
jgi:hypothetical protein